MSEDKTRKDVSMEEESQEKHGEKDAGGKEKQASGKKDKKKSDHLKEELKETEKKLSDLNDKYLRLYSEFDNYRKRTLKEKGELIKTASEDAILSLLPVLDDFERAIKALETKEGAEESLEGILLIYNKFKNTLQQKGLESMDSMGKEFDVDYHEAITNIPAPSEDMKGKVVDVIQKGYLLNGKVIRFARVVVGA